MEHLNGNIHYQMFCGIMINPSFPITNYKIEMCIRDRHNLEAKLEKVEHAIKSRTDDVVDFKQKTAYEMRISDWSSDVCSSDLQEENVRPV